jgi:hypothetical protein
MAQTRWQQLRLVGTGHLFAHFAACTPVPASRTIESALEAVHTEALLMIMVHRDHDLTSGSDRGRGRAGREEAGDGRDHHDLAGP